MYAKIARSGPGSRILVSGRDGRRTKERGKRRSKGEKRGENKTLTLEPLIINAPVCLLSRHARCASRVSVNSFRGRIAGETEKEGERRGTY